MPNIIELNLLENKSIVATMQGYPLGNENSYKIIAGEGNSTKFIVKSIPNQYANARLTVEMVNSQGLGIAERELSEIEVDLVSYKGFILPVGMAVAGYGYVSIKAYIGDEVAVFQPLKLKVWNTIPQWQDYVDKTANAKVVDGYLILTENGNEYNLGYVQGDTGAKIISTVFIGQDANGGNVYKQTFDNGITAIFVAPKGEQGVGISAITSGTATESGGYTVTPITFEKTDGSTQTVEIKATGGITEERVKELIDEEVGEIETALDRIIAIQNTLIGGGV